jgi:hypothetical protein
MTNRLAGKNLFRRKSVARERAEVRRGLEGPAPKPAERLL